MPHFKTWDGPHCEYYQKGNGDTFNFNENIQDVSSLPTERVGKIDSLTIKQGVVEDATGSTEDISSNGELFDVDANTPPINTLFEHDLIA
ncbi:MAG: hypothetical protein AAGF81_17030 [Pseudomonadota bacterium]